MIWPLMFGTISKKITIKLAEVLYRKLLKNNIVLQKNQVDKYRKKFLNSYLIKD